LTGSGLLWWHFDLEMEGFASLNCLIHWGAKSSFPVSDDDCPNGGWGIFAQGAPDGCRVGTQENRREEKGAG